MEVKSKAPTLQCFPKSSQMVSCDCWTTSGNWISHGTPSVGLCGAARINTCHWWFQSRKPQKESRLPSDLARILSLILFVLKVVGILLSRLDICRYDPFFLRDGWKGHHIINSNPFKNVRVRDSCFFTKWRNILVLRLTKRCQGLSANRGDFQTLVIAPVCTEHRFAKSSPRAHLPKWARGDDELSFLGHSISSDFMTWCSLSICGWTPTNGKVMRDPGIPLQVVTVHQFHLLMFTKLDLKSQVSQNPCKFLGDSREDQKKFGVELPFSST